MGFIYGFRPLSSATGNNRFPRIRPTKTWLTRSQSDGTPLCHTHLTNSSAGTTVDRGGSSDAATTDYVNAGRAPGQPAGPPHRLTSSGDFDPPPGEPLGSVDDAHAAESVKQPREGTRRLGGLWSLLRAHKVRRRGSLNSAFGPTGEDAYNVLDDERKTGDPTKPKRLRRGDGEEQLLRESLDEMKDPFVDRKFRTPTIVSDSSEHTNVTVCRHPSQRTSTPIATVDQDYGRQGPFEDRQRAGSHRGLGLNPLSDPATAASHSTGLSSSEYSGHGPQLFFPGVMLERPPNPIIRYLSSNSMSVSQPSSYQRTLSNDSSWLSQFDPRKAAIAYNELAGRLHLQPLSLDGEDQSGLGELSRSMRIALTTQIRSIMRMLWKRSSLGGGIGSLGESELCGRPCR